MTPPHSTVHQYSGAVFDKQNYIIPTDPTMMRYNQQQQQIQLQQQQQLQKLWQLQQVQQQPHWAYDPLLVPTTIGQRSAYGGPTNSALNVALCPRPFEVIHAEQMFLLEQLNQKNDYATKQLREWALGEDSAANMDGVWRQEADKKRHCLQRQIAEMTAWEKGILRRLSELHLEIQCRERWCQLQQEMVERQARQWNESIRYKKLSRHPLQSYHLPWGPVPHSISNPAHGPPVNEFVRSGLPCNGGNFALDWDHQHGQHGDNGGYRDAKPVVDVPSPCGITAWGIREPKVEQNENGKTGETSSSGETLTENTTCTQPARKRMSLPSLEYAWADTVDMDDEGHKCLGYAIDE